MPRSALMERWYPDESERLKFAENVQAELENREYKLYTFSYKPSEVWLMFQAYCSGAKTRSGG